MDRNDPMDPTDRSRMTPELAEALDEIGVPVGACAARTRAGTPCRNQAVLGGRRCRMHGGVSPQALAKAAERLTEARDLALERLFERLGAEGHVIDPKVLLEVVVKLSDKVELLEGRATGRTETVTAERQAAIRADLKSRLEELAAKRLS